MDKSADAFRTISEVAEVLETPAHVLRFWESRFPQIKPVKRAGGRRYYRPADVALLAGIRQLLHNDGMTIRGVQKVLREQGVRHVAALGGAVEAPEVDFDLIAVEVDVETAPPVSVVVQMPIQPRPVPPPDDIPAQAAVSAEEAAPEALSDALTASEVVAEAVSAEEAEPGAFIAAETAEPTPEEAIAAPEPLIDPAPEGDGFLAFSLPRSPRHRLVPDPKQPLLPFDAEAPHIWVEPEPTPEALVTSLRPAPPPKPAPAPMQVPDLAGISARLRHLAAPLSPSALPAFAEAHSRLGLLHAQMAEAQRLRRTTL